MYMNGVVVFLLGLVLGIMMLGQEWGGYQGVFIT